MKFCMRIVDIYILFEITDTEGEVALISAFDPIAKVTSDGFGPHHR